MKKRKLKKQKRILIVSTISILILLTIGYAAFSTNISLNAKGNIIETDPSCFETVNNENGTISITDYDASCGTKVKIPDTINGKSVTVIADALYDPVSTTYSKAFTKKNIEIIILPKYLEEIGIAAFDNNNIKTLTIPDTVTKIGDSAFRHNDITILNLPDHYIEYGVSPFNDNKLPDQEAFIYKQNEDNTYDTTTLISYAGVKTENIVIPENVKTIGIWSFRAGSMTGTFDIPDTVTTIEQAAFEWTTISHVNIGNGVTEIATSAFGWCGELETVTIGSSIEKIAADAFRNSDNIKTITINRKEGSVSGEPWGAEGAEVIWTGTN